MTCAAFSIKFAKTNQKFAENSEFCEKNSPLLVNYSLHSLVFIIVTFSSSSFFSRSPSTVDLSHHRFLSILGPPFWYPVTFSVFGFHSSSIRLVIFSLTYRRAYSLVINDEARSSLGSSIYSTKREKKWSGL